jgi:hypothetical protein
VVVSDSLYPVDTIRWVAPLECAEKIIPSEALG